SLTSAALSDASTALASMGVFHGLDALNGRHAVPEEELPEEVLPDAELEPASARPADASGALPPSAVDAPASLRAPPSEADAEASSKAMGEGSLSPSHAIRSKAGRTKVRRRMTLLGADRAESSHGSQRKRISSATPQDGRKAHTLNDRGRA
ncbi:MAG: hypothetical protein RL385_3973, partial [Pseudomonadota bacterium]